MLVGEIAQEIAIGETLPYKYSALHLPTGVFDITWTYHEWIKYFPSVLLFCVYPILSS